MGAGGKDLAEHGDTGVLTEFDGGAQTSQTRTHNDDVELMFHVATSCHRNQKSQGSQATSGLWGKLEAYQGTKNLMLDPKQPCTLSNLNKARFREILSLRDIVG
jgi:hypothetical protein